MPLKRSSSSKGTALADGNEQKQAVTAKAGVASRVNGKEQEAQTSTIAGSKLRNPSSNSLGSDNTYGIHSDAFIGDYDMKRSPSTQAFMFEQLQYRENKLRRQRVTRNLPRNVPLTELFRRDEPFEEKETTLAADVLSSTAEVFMEGVDSIVDDNFWKCFEPHKPGPWNWNLYLRPLYLVGVLVRYLVVFPVRLVVFILGWVIFGIAMLLIQTLIPKGETRKSLEHSMISFQCGVFTFTWGAVIRFHGSPPYRPQNGTNCVFVANHTSMIDVIVLQQSRCFSLVGQRHKGWVKFLQEVVLGCLQCIWFDRGEMKDRAIVARRLTEHARDPTRIPLLVFPEGTCVNNEYCIQFKKGVFELGVPIAPVAIKYNKMFVDPFWNSREQSFLMHLVELMTSWCLICDVYYLEPQTIRQGESAVQFAARVKSMIANTAKLKDVDWDGYMKYWKPSKRYVDSMQKRNAEILRNIKTYHSQDGTTSPFGSHWTVSGPPPLPPTLKQRIPHKLPSTKEEQL